MVLDMNLQRKTAWLVCGIQTWALNIERLVQMQGIHLKSHDGDSPEALPGNSITYRKMLQDPIVTFLAPIPGQSRTEVG